MRATDQAGNTDPAATEAFTIDTVAPSATITSPPHGTTDDNTPSFDFSSSIRTRASSARSTPAPPTTSPAPAPTPSRRRSQTAPTPSGCGPPTRPATPTRPPPEAFTIDTVAPSATITSPPHGTTDDTTPSFDFSSSESERELPVLARHRHRRLPALHQPLRQAVAARRRHLHLPGAGHRPGRQHRPGRHRGLHDRHRRARATITSPPHGTTDDNTPSFDFSSSDPNSSFQCSLDTGTADYQPCTSPYAKPSPLADGAYTFRVRATDQAGNTDPAATEAFTIDTVAQGPQTFSARATDLAGNVTPAPPAGRSRARPATT